MLPSPHAEGLYATAPKSLAAPAMSLPPLLFPSLLADRKLNPGAVVLEAGAGDTSALLPLLTDDDFVSFAATFPCFFGVDFANRMSPESCTALLNAGCKMMTVSPHRSDEQTKPELPQTFLWLTGDWYLAPPVRTSGNQAASRGMSLKLLQLVAHEADTCEIEAILRQDPVLAYHLLRLVNSFGAGVGRTISSFSQAILILGRQQLKRWLNLMLFAASRDDYRSAMLLARVAVRARSMELLAKSCGLDRLAQEHAFMAGMLSMLGILFGMALADVLNPLKLNDSLTRALLHRKGELGSLLQALEYGERADDAGLSGLLLNLDLTTTDYNRAVLEAHQWMLRIIRDERRDGTDA